MSHLIASTGIGLAIIFTCAVFLRWDRPRCRDRARRRGGLDVRPALGRQR